jgi:hypothetical protein
MTRDATQNANLRHHPILPEVDAQLETASQSYRLTSLSDLMIRLDKSHQGWDPGISSSRCVHPCFPVFDANIVQGLEVTCATPLSRLIPLSQSLSGSPLGSRLTSDRGPT